MSTYTDASLIMFPSGYKEDKIYSLKPTDGSGDLTFTRASTATRVNADGLIEKARTNLNTYSQNFTATGGWAALFGSTITPTANYGTAPDGTTTSTRIVFSGGSQIYSKTISGLTGNIGVFSLWIKGTAGQTIVITYGGAIDKLVTLGSGWTRFNTNGNSASNNTIYINTFLSATARDIEVWGGQVELSPSATEYIPTTTTAVSVGMLADVPRIDYTGGGCGKLLLEKQSTNLMYPSEDFTNANWSGGNYTIVANDLTSPDGTQNADKFTTTSTTAENYMRISNISILANIGSSYTTTIFAKKGTGNFLRIRNLFVTNGGTDGNAWFNLNTGAVGTVQSSQTASIQDMGNGWYRCSLTGVVGSVNSFSLMDFGFTNADATNFPSANVDGYLWGAQVEASSYPTSYIPCPSSSSVTRLADAAYKTGISSLIGQTSGSVFLDFTVDTISAQTNNPVLWYMKDGAAGERYVELYSNGNLAYVDAGSVTNASITKTGLTVGRHKCAIAYATNDFVFYVDGVQVGTDTSGTPNGFSTFGLQYYNAAYNGQQMVNQAIVFPTRLTNTQLQSLTSL